MHGATTFTLTPPLAAEDPSRFPYQEHPKNIALVVAIVILTAAVFALGSRP
jgi:hypothetical protein